MLTNVLLFALGFVLLIIGGDKFVDGATGVAKRYHIPELLIGATVVSIGTTLPEVMVSATSAAKGIGDIAYGNAIGSIICNTSLIAALTVAIRPAPVGKKDLIKPVIFFFTAAIIYAGVSYMTGYFSRFTGIILLLIFVVYMVMIVKDALKGSAEHKEAAATEAGGDGDKNASDSEGAETGAAGKNFKDSILYDLLMIVIGAVFITIGANLLVDNGTIIATALGVPTSVIALTFVALGTSLPELVTAITSLIKGHGALSLGNVIGANLFNLVLVSGLSITIQPFNIPVEKTIAGMNASLAVDMPVMFGVMIILTVPSIIRGKLSRIQGISLLAIYAAYIVFQFML